MRGTLFRIRGTQPVIQVHTPAFADEGHCEASLANERAASRGVGFEMTGVPVAVIAAQSNAIRMHFGERTQARPVDVAGCAARFGGADARAQLQPGEGSDLDIRVEVATMSTVCES